MQKLLNKYALCIAIISIILLGIVNNVYANEEKEIIKEYNYKIINNSTVEIVKYLGSEKNVSIPAKLIVTL